MFYDVVQLRTVLVVTPPKAFQSPEGWNRASCTRAFSQDRLAQRLTKFHSVPRPGNQSRRWSEAYLQIDASLFSPSVSPKISMVSDSTSVNSGVGPRLRRQVYPRICRTASSITQYSQTRSRSMLPKALKPWQKSLIFRSRAEGSLE